MGKPVTSRHCDQKGGEEVGEPFAEGRQPAPKDDVARLYKGGRKWVEVEPWAILLGQTLQRVNQRRQKHDRCGQGGGYMREVAQKDTKRSKEISDAQRHQNKRQQNE